jgi:hypothetical protein
MLDQHQWWRTRKQVLWAVQDETSCGEVKSNLAKMQISIEFHYPLGSDRLI